MIYAAVIACGLHGCAVLSADAGPYASEADCRAYHEARRALVILMAQHIAAAQIVEARAQRVHRMSPGPERWRERSRFFAGIAEAMADQWGGLLTGEAAA